jgi:hypothetical protein
MKKEYSAPILVLYGDLKQVTLGGDMPNADCPDGCNNTAYPPTNVSCS